MKNKMALALALAGVLSLSALVPSALAADLSNGEGGTVVEETQKAHRKHGKGEKVAAPEDAIGKDAAKAKALADAGVTAEQAGKVKSRVSELDDGTVIYKVHFTCDGQRYSYQINAVTGAVVDKSVKEVTEDTAETTEHRGHGKHGKGKGGKTVEQAAETASTAV